MNLIDPTVERERGQHEPPFWPVWIDTFSAAHIVAFGTHWRAADYRNELSDRLRAGDALPFLTDAPFYNALVRRLLEERNDAEAVLHYASSRGIGIQLQQACQLLAEAAARGQVVTRACRTADDEPQQLPAHEWQGRERYRFSRSHLFARGQASPLVAVEWHGVQFWAEDVDGLRRDGLLPPTRPSPILAEVVPITPLAAGSPPVLNQFQSSPATLKAAVQRMEKPNYSRPDLAVAVCDLYREAGGRQRAANPVASVVKTWKQQGLTLSGLIALAGE